jgi:hypothetical protein
VDIRGDVHYLRSELANLFAPALQRRAESIDAEAQERKLPAQVVVQFAADALALRFLTGDQASSQLAIALVGTSSPSRPGRW